MGTRSDISMLAELAYMVGKAGDYQASPSNRYARLWTVKPALTGLGGTEATGGSYAALDIISAFPTPSLTDTSVANSGLVTFVQATANWGDIVAVTISLASTGTSFLHIADLDNTVTVNNTDTFEFAIGAFIVEADG